MRTELITETTETPLALSPGQAAALEASGRRLASTKLWWGERAGDKEQSEPTVIRCRPLGGGSYAVRVTDAVGIVVAGDMQIVVEPKIDIRHFLYLLNASGKLPKIDPAKGAADADASFWQLVARWYVDQLQHVVQRDLVRDYRESEAQLSLARGRLLSLPTARSYYQGVPRPTCRFEDFDIDTPLNRILKAAATTVAASSQLPGELRRKARALLRPFDEVGELRADDLAAGLERRNAWYADALSLARSVLIGQGRALSAGPQAAWTFLFRTPYLIEQGVRQVLVGALSDWGLAKETRRMMPSSLSLTPDLVVNDGLAVVDIKYKLAGAGWNRADLYQAVAFAAGFRTQEAAVIGFAKVTSPPLPAVRVGEFGVTSFTWRALAAVAPSDAAAELIGDVTAWLRGLPS